MPCRVIEHQSYNEVFCEGEPAADKGITETTAPIPKKESISIKAVTPATPQLDPSLKVYGIIVTATNLDVRTNTFNVAFKCEVYSEEDIPTLYVTIAGKDREASEVVEVELSKGIVGGRSNTVDGIAKIDAQRFYSSHTWEPKMVRKDNFIAILEASPSARAPEFYVGPAGFVEGTAEPSALKALSTTASAAATAVVPSPGSSTSIDDLPTLASAYGSLGSVIVLNARNGNVFFTHQKHQDRLQQECSKCHASSTGRISGFGKDMAHKLCKGCHEAKKSGPTKCSQCHKK